MSVIFGVKEKDRIIIAGDKRGSGVDGEIISDEIQKVIPINKHLCIAFAGNVSIANLIMNNVEKMENKDTILVEDLLDIIAALYKNIVENQCNIILGYPFYSLVAGTGRDGKGHLYNVGKFKSGFDYKEVPRALYHPLDTSREECSRIFLKNYELHHRDFYKRTIKEISQISNIVSSTGSCWIYGFGSRTGRVSDF